MSENFVQSTRDSYDRVADRLADLWHGDLAERPLDRAVLAAFAELAGDAAAVLDAGCGPGETTAQLVALGLQVRAIDLSESMVELARGNNPDIDVVQGSMTDLTEAAGSLDGVMAYYSTIHIPDDLLPRAFAEFARVLRPGGVLLLTFQVGTEPLVFTEIFDERVDLAFLRRTPQEVWTTLDAAGFDEYATTVRQPVAGESTPQAYLLAIRR